MEKFSYEANGYNRSEVNRFVSDVIRETEGIIVRIKRQNAELETLRNELKKYKEISNTSQKETEEKAEKIINDARYNASRIVNEALLKAEKIENDRKLLERNMRIFKKKLKSIIEQQMAVVDEIEILELEEE